LHLQTSVPPAKSGLPGFTPLSTVGWMRMLLGLMVFLSGSDSFLRQNMFLPWLLELNVLLFKHTATHSVDESAPLGLREKIVPPAPHCSLISGELIYRPAIEGFLLWLQVNSAHT
jgi:hypothetical protein